MFRRLVAGPGSPIIAVSHWLSPRSKRFTLPSRIFADLGNTVSLLISLPSCGTRVATRAGPSNSPRPNRAMRGSAPSRQSNNLIFRGCIACANAKFASAPVEMAPVRTEVLNHVDHAGRQLVRHGENIGHRGAQCPQPLAHRNAALEQKGADLVDHSLGRSQWRS